VQRRARADASVRTVTVCCHRAAARFGFFLEFDRGTERPAEHAAKLASYYRYRNSGAYSRDYASFPTLLVVTTTEVAEARFALQLHPAQQHFGGAPLLAFLTTSDRIREDKDGVLGPIWRGPSGQQLDHLARVVWLPGCVRITGPSGQRAWQG
jgi:hypothetical protein